MTTPTPGAPMMRLLCALLTFALTLPMAATALAEDSGDAPEQMRTVLKSTMFVDVREVAHILEILDVEFALKEDQNTIVLRASSKYMDTALAVIEALDGPRPSFDMRVFVVAASKEETPGSDMPEDLQKAVQQLQSVFGYRSFSLLDAVTLRVLEGRQAEIRGGVMLSGDNSPTPYRLKFGKAHLVSDLDGAPGPDRQEGDVWKVRLDGLDFSLTATVEGQPRASLKTDVQILEGQKAIVGSSTPVGSGETLLLIIEATVLKKNQ